VAAAVVVLAAATGCSSSHDGGEPSTATAPATTPAEETETPALAPGEVAVSPGGVTTAVGTPAASTEEEYFRACLTARQWMDEQGGDPKSLIEPYLQMVQTAEEPGPGTFGARWAELPPERQSAVIVAVQAAADQLCG